MIEKKPVRVLVSSPLGVGGVSNMMLNIQKHLNREEINFDYLTIHEGHQSLEDEVVALGSTKYVADADCYSRGVVRQIMRMNEIRKVCKENKITYFHYNADSPLSVINILAAKLGGVKFAVIHAHNAAWGNNSIASKVGRKVGYFLQMILCDRYISCSKLAAEFVFPKKVSKNNEYLLLKNGIDLEKYDYNEEIRTQYRNKLGVEDKFVVGHAGRFTNQKNHSFLLDIFQKIYEKDKSAVLLLFGVGELMEPMKKKVVQLGIEEAVVFYGSSNEMHKMWQAMDVFVMPSLHEGLPVTGIEAQASGLPCVFADTITREVDVSKKSEFLSLSDSPEVWADCALKHKTDVRESGVPMLKKAHYDIQQTADIVAELYLNVAK